MGDAADILTTGADCILKPIALIFRISFEIIVIKVGTSEILTDSCTIDLCLVDVGILWS